MKHGDKAKKKASKASGKKASPPRSKAHPSGKISKARAPKAKKPEAGRPGKKSGDGKGKARTGAEGVSFSNPVVAAAFKRAVKKYPNAFRRLTD